MADVPLSLAIISTSAPVIVGILPLTVGWFRDAKREKRAEEERRRTEQAQLTRKKETHCVELLRLAREFRVLAENTCDPAGPGLDALAEQVRESAARLASQADKVEFMIDEAEIQALSLASAAGRLAARITDKENRELGSQLVVPDFTEFDGCLVDFKRAARAALGGQPQERL